MSATLRAGGAARAGGRACALLLAAAMLASCGLADAAAPNGLRPGVDVPEEVGHVAARPLGFPALAPSGEGGYAFARTRPDGSPVTFDPCRPLRFVVRPDGEPRGGRAMLDSVLTELGIATGLVFTDDGATDEPPTEDRAAFQPERYGQRWAPVLIAWSDPAETPELAGRVLGRAGPDVFGTNGKDSERLVSGMAVFNGPEISRLISSGRGAQARAVLLHELGHLVGLDHVNDAFQVMFDTNLYPLDRYAAGDLRGLELLGMGRCFRDY